MNAEIGDILAEFENRISLLEALHAEADCSIRERSLRYPSSPPLIRINNIYKGKRHTPSSQGKSD